jgi:signal transduction histidine kinase
MQDLDQQDRAQSTSQIGHDLVHLVSHQLLNSASRLKMICDLWSEPDALSASDKAEVLEILQDEVNFLHHLGRDVLQLDLTSSVELPVNLNPMNLIELIKQMLPSFRLQGPDRDFESYYEVDLPLVWGDAERLRDVLDNLISNALKYSAPFSPIIISIQRDDDQVTVSVTNSGSSIPAADKEQIFTKFYRGQGHQQAGYGLGLYLARRLVGQHGGRIWVESLPAEVTTFYFTLPLVGQEQWERPFSGNINLPTLPIQNGSAKSNGIINLKHHLGTTGAEG